MLHASRTRRKSMRLTSTHKKEFHRLRPGFDARTWHRTSGDRYSCHLLLPCPKYFMALGLIGSGIVNILFAFGNSVQTFAILWSFNALFQAAGWPPCALLLTTWYSKGERGRWWSIWNTAHNVGGSLTPIFVTLCVKNLNWRAGMLIPGIVAVVTGFFIITRLQDKPTSMGLPTIGEWRNDQLELDQQQSADTKAVKPPVLELVFKHVLSNFWIWLLATASALVYIVRTAINDWGNQYLEEVHNFSLMEANSCVSLFEIGGFVGSLAAGWGSDIFFGGERGPVNIIFSGGVFSITVAMAYMTSSAYMVQGLLFFMMGFFVFGPQMLIGMAAAEVSHKEAAGASTGFTGLTSYAGAAIAGYPLSQAIQAYSWKGFFVINVISAAGVFLLLLPFSFMKKKTPVADEDLAIQSGRYSERVGTRGSILGSDSRLGRESLPLNKAEA
eukprot:Selendium_serpulae@DN5188_c0_g1_i3.p1